MPLQSCPPTVNLWDDYAEDGAGPQHTYAYVESGAESDEEACELLRRLERRVKEWAFAHNEELETQVVLYDAAQDHPSLVGTECTELLFRRWELCIEGLTHAAREKLVAAYTDHPLTWKGQNVVLVTES